MWRPNTLTGRWAQKSLSTPRLWLTKRLELIEAHWLFGLEAERLEVVIHPQSVVHSFVQQIDGSILAQLSPPSMTFGHTTLPPLS